MTDDQSKRKDAGKLDLTYVPVEWTMLQADLCSAGAYKYDRDAWRRNVTEPRRLIASLERHQAKAKIGEIHDDDTGCLHWTQVAWNANVLAMHEVYNQYGLPISSQLTYEEIEKALYREDLRAEFYERWKDK